MAAKVSCIGCGIQVPTEFINIGDLLPCPGCRKPIRVDLFPACYRPPETADTGNTLTDSTDAACFYHPEKQAAVPCDACGRFLCSLCDVEVAGQHLCPGCVDSGRRQGRLAAMENKRTLYDRLALMYAVWPILAWPFTLITAPYVVYTCFRHYRSPGSFLGGSRWRFWVAGLLAGAQIVGWLVLLVFLLSANL